MFTSGRSFQIKDVIIDSMGSITGIYIYIYLNYKGKENNGSINSGVKLN